MNASTTPTTYHSVPKLPGFAFCCDCSFFRRPDTFLSSDQPKSTVPASDWNSRWEPGAAERAMASVSLPDQASQCQTINIKYRVKE